MIEDWRDCVSVVFEMCSYFPIFVEWNSENSSFAMMSDHRKSFFSNPRQVQSHEIPPS